jgi:hypothetical protein
VVTWTTGNATIATVSGSGLATGGVGGTATITATSEGQSGPAAVTVTAPVSTPPGTVTDLAVAGVTANSVTLAFTEVTDGTGQPASYDVRSTVGIIAWGAAVSVTQGTCATPVAGSGVGVKRSCTVLGLAAATGYQFQVVAFRGTPNLNAVYGGLSNVASGTTAASTAPVAAVTVSPATASVVVGQTVQLVATPKDASGNPLSGRVVTWTTSNATIATVSGSGLVTGGVAGTATITATSEGQSGPAALTVTAVLPPPPPPTGLWPNEPAGFTLLTDEPFNALSENGWNGVQRQTTNGSGLSVVSDLTGPVSPPNVLAFKYAVGYQTGSEPGAEYYAPATPVKETYVGFWWKPSNPWQFHPSGVNKIDFLFSSGPENIYIMLYNDFTAPPTIQVVPQYSSDTRRLAPNVTGTPVVLGVWHRIEWYVKYATTGTSRDGVVRWWVDGVLQGAYTDLQTPADAGIVEYTTAPTWGGASADTKTETDFYWFDHIHISRR